ncbi:MAG: AEC family transporter [Pseudomonadota bacterium]
MLATLLLPLFLLAGAGYVLARSPWIKPGWQAGLGEVTTKLLIPALLLGGAYKYGLLAGASWQVLGAFYLPLTGLFVIVALLARSATRALTATYSNTAFVGIPVLLQAFGHDSLQFAFPVIAFHSLIAFTLYYLASGSGHVGASLANAARNPIIVSLMLGLALNVGGVVLPHVLQQVLDMLAAAALPCALIVLGASLAGLHLRSFGEACAFSAIKLLLFPACVLGMAKYVMHTPAQATAVLVVMASCPVGVNAALVVQADGQDAAPVSSAILMSSLACIVTMPMWLMLLN